MINEREQLTRKRDYRIALANEVIDEMRIGLSAKQQDILDFMLKEIKADDAPSTRYKISISDYCRINNITDKTNGKNYQDIKKGVRELNNNSKWINIDKHRIQLVYWFKNIVIDYDAATIEYSIDETMYQYLFDLIRTGNYTQYRYREKAAMSSKYSKSLYTILLRYHNVNIHNPLLPIDKLKTLLAAECYDRYQDFRRFVLDVAEDEINRFTPLRMKYEPKKTIGSRAYTHISFQLDYQWKQEDIEENYRAFGETEYLLPF
jgi:plasmid replication initiation protein